MEIRAYDPDRDLAHVERTWREVGWVDDDDQVKQLSHFLAGGGVLVAEIDGEVECCVSRHPATMRYDSVDLDASVVSSVTTSRVARRQGLASRLTAQILVDMVDDGAAVALLGMFDQGFYNRLGFGTGASMLRHRFDPRTLQVAVPRRRPVRLGVGDWQEAHDAMLRRQRSHGGVVMNDPLFTRSELSWKEDPVALGFRDDDGRLTHFIWGQAKDEHGPYEFEVLVYEDDAQLLELLGLIRLLGDQVRGVWLPEPPELTIDDLLEEPERHRHVTKGADHPASVRGGAWWQARVLDLPVVVAARSWSGTPVACNVRVRDPLATHPRIGWGGVDGEWVLRVGATSSAQRGTDADLPTLGAGVGALTRLLLGVSPATSLALTDDLVGPPELLAALDEAFRLPSPNPGMYF